MKKLSREDIMNFVIDQEMKEYFVKYFGDNIRFANMLLFLIKNNKM